MRLVLGMTQYFSMLLGTLALALVADASGRLKTVFACLLIAFIGGLSSAFAFNNLAVFIVLRGIVGFATGMQQIYKVLRENDITLEKGSVDPGFWMPAPVRSPYALKNEKKKYTKLSCLLVRRVFQTQCSVTKTWRFQVVLLDSGRFVDWRPVQMRKECETNSCF